MAHVQPVLGFFGTIAEAQQAVQLLLVRGFTGENLELTTPASLPTIRTDESLPSPAEADRSSGRFYSTLFNSRARGPSRLSILVTVQTQSADEARQVADLLAMSGAADQDEAVP